METKKQQWGDLVARARAAKFVEWEGEGVVLLVFAGCRSSQLPIEVCPQLGTSSRGPSPKNPKGESREEVRKEMEPIFRRLIQHASLPAEYELRQIIEACR